jgi:hypothetical protein
MGGSGKKIIRSSAVIYNPASFWNNALYVQKLYKNTRAELVEK